MTNLIPTRLFSFLLIFSIVILGSCKKKEVEVPDASYIRFVNASPTFGTYNIYLDDKMLNSAAIPFGGTVSYSPFIFGKHTIKYTTASSNQPVFTKEINLTGNQIHSLYLVDVGAKMDALLFIDNASVTSTTKAFVKFINLSPDAPSLNLDIAGGANLFTNTNYKVGTQFVQVDPKTYTFNLTDFASGAIKTTLPDIEFVAGRYYTIIARGMINPGTNEQSFSAQSIINQ
ncbi:MAG TPA: DUF4397 domain-containing protein [Pedobacter sp.]|nr:DUF4397 domain-containing protein [Pedobacter sp.]